MIYRIASNEEIKKEFDQKADAKVKELVKQAREEIVGLLKEESFDQKFFTEWRNKFIACKADGINYERVKELKEEITEIFEEEKGSSKNKEMEAIRQTILDQMGEEVLYLPAYSMFYQDLKNYINNHSSKEFAHLMTQLKNVLGEENYSYLKNEDKFKILSTAMKNPKKNLNLIIKEYTEEEYLATQKYFKDKEPLRLHQMTSHPIHEKVFAYVKTVCPYPAHLFDQKTSTLPTVNMKNFTKTFNEFKTKSKTQIQESMHNSLSKFTEKNDQPLMNFYGAIMKNAIETNQVDLLVAGYNGVKGCKDCGQLFYKQFEGFLPESAQKQYTTPLEGFYDELTHELLKAREEIFGDILNKIVKSLVNNAKAFPGCTLEKTKLEVDAYARQNIRSHYEPIFGLEKISSKDTFLGRIGREKTQGKEEEFFIETFYKQYSERFYDIATEFAKKYNDDIRRWNGLHELATEGEVSMYPIPNEEYSIFASTAILNKEGKVKEGALNAMFALFGWNYSFHKSPTTAHNSVYGNNLLIYIDE